MTGIAFFSNAQARSPNLFAVTLILVLLSSSRITSLDHDQFGERRFFERTTLDELGSRFHGNLAFLLRILGDQCMNRAILEGVHFGRGSVVGHDLDVAGSARLTQAGNGTDRTLVVRGEDAGQVRMG
jgi:hypothetical protein